MDPHRITGAEYLPVPAREFRSVWECVFEGDAYALASLTNGCADGATFHLALDQDGAAVGGYAILPDGRYRWAFSTEGAA